MMNIYLSIELKHTDIFVTNGWKPNKHQTQTCDVAMFQGNKLLDWLKKKNKKFSSEVLTNAYLQNASRRKLYPLRIKLKEFRNEKFNWIHKSQYKTSAKIIGYYFCEDTDGINLVAEVDEWCRKSYWRSDAYFFNTSVELMKDEFDINFLSPKHRVSLCLYKNTIQIAG